MLCSICPRNCKVNREENFGFCKEKKLKINRAQLHYFEEPIICTDKGSGAIFFSGCNLRCIFCQNYQISSENFGIEISVIDLVNIMKKLEKMGAININLVTPTHFVKEIIEALKIYKPKIPVVYNTSGYEKPETIEMLKGYVDIFLFDIKYVDKNLSKEYSKAEDYFYYASQSLLKARKIIPEDIFDGAIMKKGIIVRHLMLPKASNDTIKVIDFVNEALGNKTYFSLLNQYTPMYKAKLHPILKDRVSSLEYKRAVKHLINLGFENAFTQEECSCGEDFIPNFMEDFDLQKFLRDI